MGDNTILVPSPTIVDLSNDEMASLITNDEDDIDPATLSTAVIAVGSDFFAYAGADTGIGSNGQTTSTIYFLAYE